MNPSSTNSFSLIRGFKQVGFFTAISRILGLVRDVLLALVLGAGAASDAFLVALKLPNFFRRITAEGALTNVFLPTYEEEIAKNNKQTPLTLEKVLQIFLEIGLLGIFIYLNY